ncbi:formate transporter [Saccharobesus litoralis]|uniref:Formate transporter n=1 Tax=Saccharobesus litoralis TaxID=2172099 RepID=A0A2S0VW24_9ALTE|nr:formate/nitrite transporter family protein [Saccharobesus litoralis]AWB68419.1 formate transporter [Saccharobesus litoralis]
MSEPKKILAPDGSELSSTVTAKPKRGQEREQENQEYVSVIVKRNDECFRHPDDILENAISEGMEQLSRPLLSLGLSAVAAGMILCFTAMAVALMAKMHHEYQFEFPLNLGLALVYPLGFVLCILSRTTLFTEHTATSLYPVLDKKAPFSRLLKLWTVVTIGNLIGGIFASLLLARADSIIHAAKGYEIIANHVLSYSTADIFVSSVLAGWLMALGAWIVLSTHSTFSQITSIFIVTFLIGLAGLHHIIAGSVEMFTHYFVNQNMPFTSVLNFIWPTFLGNLLGGSVFVAVLNYGHIRQSQIGSSD